ncbi:DUF2971 domain-containing protein [Aminobacter ciceronei]|uniref:DUF2971 domain-containing protein n=2 Tax=Aminobacter ciceronei TaxID=150723 RepID=UPI0015F91AD1|nr:DUF2971 domain-containing protein [Aminobacter ciceronei]
MRLYHFTTEQFGLVAIRDRRLKVARVMELNDPFEFLGPIFADKSERQRMRKFKAEVDKDFGLICLSDNWSHPLLWGHYADKHKGVCLGFDVLQPEDFEAVEYVEERPPMNQFGISAFSDLPEESIKRMLHLKFHAWSYEAEFRTFIDLKATVYDEKSKLHFVPFRPTMKLAQVIMGWRSKSTRTEVSKALGWLKQDVEVFKSRPAFQEFEVVRNRDDALWE